MEGKDFITLRSGALEITLCRPGTFYRGTRFDWCGVFRSITFQGRELSGLWYDGNDPLRHDNVCGCSEEYAPVWIDGMHCVKVGVGILEVPPVPGITGASAIPSAPEILTVSDGRQGYDRFRLYKVADAGGFALESGSSEDGEVVCLTFRHTLDGFYEYEKTVGVSPDNSFFIEHRLRWDYPQAAATDCYNHNFFTFGRNCVDARRRISLGSVPQGHWREDSVNGYVCGSELRFERQMQPGEKCFIGDLVLPEVKGRPYGFSVADSGLSVDVRSDAPMDHAVFWSNHRVACLEPYVDIPLNPGETGVFSIRYGVSQN